MAIATLKRRTSSNGKRRPNRRQPTPVLEKVDTLQDLRERTRRLLDREVQFVPNRYFRDPRAEKQILGTSPETPEMARSSDLPRDLPAHLARLCESQLLSAAAERALFQRMNYLKFRVNAIRAQLDPKRPSRRAVEKAESFLAQANGVRDAIIRANMRLVISIVKKFVGPQHSFDDMLSDGTMSLMQAVDKFDYARGFRFSTYAYRAIARNAYRSIMDQHKANARFASGADDAVFDVIDDRESGWISEQSWARLRTQMAGLLDRLDRREQFIIRSRFALGAHRKVRTFQSLADKLGISKERVRQLEQRAVEKLRKMADEATVE